MDKTIVFAGPSISKENILKILPQAFVHAPVSCGDIYRAIRLQPARMIIIDGYYETGLSVWHKEILRALAEGIEIIGASSMGALRAAELSYFGMKGIGQIVDWYTSGFIDGDDEVAVLHGNAAMDYAASNIPLVEIRVTLTRALASGIMSQQQHDLVLDISRTTFYPYRRYADIITKASHIEQANWENILNWLSQHHVPLKSLDAEAALHYARTHPAIAPSMTEMVSQTWYFGKLCLDSNIRIFDQTYDWLPPSERRCIELSVQYELHLELAKEFAQGLNYTQCIIRTSNPDAYQGKDPLEVTLKWLDSQKQRIQNKKQSDELLLFFAAYFYKTPKVLKTETVTILNHFVALFMILLDILNRSKMRFTVENMASYQDPIKKSRLGILNQDDIIAFQSQYGLNEEQIDSCVKQLVVYTIGYKSLHIVPADTTMGITSYNWLYPVLRWINDAGCPSQHNLIDDIPKL